MRRPKTLRTAVVALALAIFGITAVCPGQCVLAAPAPPADDCHGHGETPAPESPASLPCCPSIVALKASPDGEARQASSIPLPATSIPGSAPRIAAPHPVGSTASLSPPSVPLFLRARVLRI